VDLTLIFVLSWIICGIATAVIASSKGRDGCGWGILGFLLGPIGILMAIGIAAVSDDHRALATGELRKCPFCAELIRREAIKCRFCGSEIHAEVASRPPQSSAPAETSEEPTSSSAVVPAIIILSLLGILILVALLPSMRDSGIAYQGPSVAQSSPTDYRLLDRQGANVFAYLGSRWSSDTVRIRQFGANLCEGSECTVRFWSDPAPTLFQLPLTKELGSAQVAEYRRGPANPQGSVKLGAASVGTLDQARVPSQPGVWSTTTGPLRTLMVLDASENRNSEIGHPRYQLGVRCDRGELQAYVDAGFPLALGTNGRVSVNVKWDGYPGVWASWIRSTDSTVAFTQDVDGFVNRGLLLTKVLHLQVSMRGGRHVTFTFDVHEYRKHAAELKAACPRSHVSTQLHEAARQEAEQIGR
jgi:hypothetical protein